MIKYRTDSGYGMKPIMAVEIERESEASVWIGGRRQSKISDYYRYHDTWAQAKDFLVARAERKLSSAKSSMQYAENELAKIQSIQEG